MGLYPRNMSYVLNKLNGYSRQKYKLSPNISESQTLTAGNTIIVPLPENSIVDLDTFAWFFTMTTPLGNIPSKHIETLISKVQVEANGRMIDEGFDGYNLLWRRLADLTLGDKETVRGVLNNGIGSTSVASNVQVSNQRYSVYNFMGFVGTAQPRCIDTSLLGSVRVIITLAPNSVIMNNPAGSAVNYTLSGNYFTIETITMNDGGLYANTLAQRLADENNPIEIPFQTFSRFSPGITSLSQTTTGTLATESLDVLIGMYQDSNASTAALVNTANATLRASQWFKTGSANLQQSYFAINNNPYPTNCFEPHDVFHQNLSAMSLAQDSLGASDPSLSNLDNFRNQMYCHMVKLNHNTATDERVKSGLNLRGTNATISYTTLGTENNITPHLFAGYTSVLRVKPFKELNVIR